MSIETTPTSLRITVDLPWDEALEKTTVALKERGFGVLTEIDVKATLKEKIDVDFRRYLILGSCNPPLAHRALSADLDVGLLLPCNVVLWETEDDRVAISTIEPRTMVGMLPDAGIEPIAEEVRTKLLAVLEAIGE